MGLRGPGGQCCREQGDTPFPCLWSLPMPTPRLALTCTSGGPPSQEPRTGASKADTGGQLGHLLSPGGSGGFQLAPCVHCVPATAHALHTTEHLKEENQISLLPWPQVPGARFGIPTEPACFRDSHPCPSHPHRLPHPVWSPREALWMGSLGEGPGQGETATFTRLNLPAPHQAQSALGAGAQSQPAKRSLGLAFSWP